MVMQLAPSLLPPPGEQPGQGALHRASALLDLPTVTPPALPTGTPGMFGSQEPSGYSELLEPYRAALSGDFFHPGDDLADGFAEFQGINPNKLGKGGPQGIVKLAMSQLGAPYVWAAANPKGPAGGPGVGFDCSGFTSWVWSKMGVRLPHMASEQQAMTRNINRQNLRVGDLVYMNYGRKAPGVADHVGLYIGHGMMIDASSSNNALMRRGVDWSHFLHGGRVR